MAEDRGTQAVFPTVPPKRGHYESWYVRLVDPDEPRGAWIRYTVHKRPQAQPRASLWFTFFDRGAAAPRAAKLTVEADELSVPAGDFVQIGASGIGPGRLSGEVRSEQLDASWALEFESRTPPFRHLPSEWMYRRALPKTKTLSPYPAALFNGTLELDGDSIEVDGWPGMMGHNWGAQHAERWIWMHGIGFEGHPDAWLDAAIGRIKIGPVTTPWIGNGCLHLDGRDIRLGGIDQVRRTEIDETPARVRFRLPGANDRSRVIGTLGADRKDFVGWRYADPDGPEHNTVNCSIAKLELVVDLDDGKPVELRTDHGATYELGMRETDHGVPIQPFPDG